MSKLKLFGTDGIRGLSNCHPITPDVATKIGAIIGHSARLRHSTNRVIIGKDTRLSSYMLENAITAGLLSAGMDVFLAGPIPTPAVSFLTRSMRCDLGIMISASHNEYQDNGIKFFDHNGEKISVELQTEIERAFINEDIAKFFCEPSRIGRAKRLDDISGRYIEFVKKIFPAGQDLTGMRIVIDCANGADYKIAPEVLWELGADVISIGISPNGENINLNCGATSTKHLQAKVVETRADIGIALDGDGDRIIVVDENGAVVDGDQIIAALAKHMIEADKLRSEYVVATIMSNMGLEDFVKTNGMEFIRTPVGDQNVYSAMKKYNASLGGEQSGHIILKKYSTTGDGLMAAINLLSIMRMSHKPTSAMLNVFEKVPQYTSKINIPGTAPLDIANKLEQISNKHSPRIQGRIVVRKSGTENIVRIMIETTSQNHKEIMEDIESDVASIL